MIKSPFDDPGATYRILMNSDRQYSLWPSFAAVPAGWNVVHEADGRDACLKHIADSGADMQQHSAEQIS